MENTHPRGQPSISEQIEIDRILRPFYLKTYSIEQTAEITRRHRVTVTKRFRKWDNENMAKLNNEFDRGDNVHKDEFLRLNQALIDDGLCRLDAIKEDISNARKNGDLSLSHLISNEDQIRRTLESLNEKRCAVKIRPGAERVIVKVIEGRVKKHVQSISRN